MDREMDNSTVGCLVVTVEVSLVDLVVSVEGRSHPKGC